MSSVFISSKTKSSIKKSWEKGKKTPENIALLFKFIYLLVEWYVQSQLPHLGLN